MLCLTAVAPAQVADLRVAVVGPTSTEAAVLLRAIESGVGATVRAIPCDRVGRDSFWNVDVVVVDWPAAEDLPTELLGEFGRWPHATVLTHGCAARWADALGLPAPETLLRSRAGELGPAVERMKMGSAAVTRHGNLLYLPKTIVVEELLAAVVRRAAQFRLDHPVVRASDDDKRARIRELAAAVSLDVPALDVSELAKQLGEQPAWKKLVTELFPDGPGATVGSRGWRRWLKRNAKSLAFDAGRSEWRLDHLARRVGVASAEYRGSRRVVVGPSDPVAARLAARVVARYGGDALRDLSTFSCWLGDRHVMWDRRRGYFRIENHTKVPPGRRATPWKVVVHDTHRDAELIWGGGPPPRPRISGRSTVRQLSQLAFLPLLLRRASATVQVREGESTADHVRLEVKLAESHCDLTSVFVLDVEVPSASVVAIERYSGERLRERWELLEVTPCGPIQLPSRWRDVRSRRGREFVIASPAWNPDLPERLSDSKDYIAGPRSK